MGISKSVSLGTTINFLDNTDNAKQKLQTYFDTILKEVTNRIDNKDITVLTAHIEINGISKEDTYRDTVYEGNTV